MTEDPLVLCVVAKGSLHDGTTALLERCFIPIQRGGRSYAARMAGLAGVEVLLSRADEIPELIATGQAHAGITGLDLVSEANLEPGADGAVGVVIEDLGFGRADLVVGVPAIWLDVTSMEDLVEVAADIRHTHGRVLRVATKFPNLTSAHFTASGFSDFRIVPSLGATEGAPKAGTADIIVDLTSTGATLEANGLKLLRDGRALRSQACLVASPDPAVWEGGRRGSLIEVVDLIEAALAAEDTRVVQARFEGLGNDERTELDQVLDDAVWVAGDGVVDLHGQLQVSKVHEALRLLRAHGARTASIQTVDLMVRPEPRYAKRFFAAVDDA